MLKANKYNSFIEIEIMENCEKENPPTKQPSKMKILQLMQKNLASVGVNPNLSLPYSVNSNILTVFSILTLFLVCNLMYALFEAQTFTEYIQSIYMCSVVIVIIFGFAIIIFNAKKLFQAIDVCENLVNASESMMPIPETLSYESGSHHCSTCEHFTPCKDRI